MSFKPTILRFQYAGFKSLRSWPGFSVRSKAETDGNGNTWQLDIKPGGDVPTSIHEDDVENDVTLTLYNIGGQDVNAKIAYVLRDSAGKAYCYEFAEDTDLYESSGQKGFAVDLPVKRSEIIDEATNILLDGTLLIDVEIQAVEESGDSLFQPTNPHFENMMNLLENGRNRSDISFKVGDTVMHAHKLILELNAPKLFDLCEDHTADLPLDVNDISPEVFRLVLRYAYGGDAPDKEDTKQQGGEIIDAANRYGMISLKMTVEKALVQLRVLNVENVSNWLLLADAKMCPLLKEYAMQYFSGRAKDVLAHDSSKILIESQRLMDELIVVKSDCTTNSAHESSNMSVSELRKRLHEEGLDVDGSKEMLLARLESNKRQKTE